MPQKLSTWVEDLAANSRQRGWMAPIVAWMFDPGFACVTLIRFATMPRRNLLRKFAARWAARMLSRRFGCYISVDAKIGRRLVLPHPIGIVIGEGCEIGNDVTIYQHVTFGRRTSEVDEYPVIGDGVIVYVGAVILGDVSIGSNAIIGANAVVLKDVPEGSSAGGIPAHLLRSGGTSSQGTVEGLVTSSFRSTSIAGQ